MDKAKILKIMGLIGSVLIGGKLIATGQVVEGVGIISAAISSVTGVVKPKES